MPGTKVFLSAHPCASSWLDTWVVTDPFKAVQPQCSPGRTRTGDIIYMEDECAGRAENHLEELETPNDCCNQLSKPLGCVLSDKCGG